MCYPESEKKMQAHGKMRSECVASPGIGGVRNVEKLDVGAGADPGTDTECLWGNGFFDGRGCTGGAFRVPGGGGRTAHVGIRDYLRL